MLGDCFRPHFQYRKGGLSARAIWKMFTAEYHFLPEYTSQPERLAELLQKLLYKQQSLRIRPNCPRHEIPMVMLGHPGIRYVKPHRKIHMSTINQMGRNGQIVVANGLFRCVWPGCFLVAAIESSDTMARVREAT